MKGIEDYIITIPDFPEEGVMFRDVTSVLQDEDGKASIPLDVKGNTSR